MCAAAMCLGGQSAQAVEYVEDKVFIEDFSIAPGQAVTLTMWIDNTCTWAYAMPTVDLPEGLVFEKFSPDEIDTEHFTTHYVSVEGTSDYVALSNEFTDSSYMDEDYLSELAYQKKYYGDELETIALVDVYHKDRYMLVNIMNDYIGVHFGMYRLLQLKVRATEDLAAESVITTRVGFIGNKSQFYLGPEIDNNFDGTPTVTRVRRVDPQPETNCDVNGDGVVDIDDVNAVVNAVLKK